MNDSSGVGLETSYDKLPIHDEFMMDLGFAVGNQEYWKNFSINGYATCLFVYYRKLEDKHLACVLNQLDSHNVIYAGETNVWLPDIHNCGELLRLCECLGMHSEGESDNGCESKSLDRIEQRDGRVSSSNICNGTQEYCQNTLNTIRNKERPV